MQRLRAVHAALRTQLHRPRLVHSLALYHDDERFSDWHTALDNNAIKNDLKRVVIHSAPDDLAEGRDYDTWSAWQWRGTYPAFTNAIDRIKELRYLTDVKLSFSDMCFGVDNHSRYTEDVETISTRLHTLQAVFKAIRQRAQDPSFSPVRSLSIENLQNAPLLEFTTSSLFKTVMKEIRDLHLLITVEANEHGPDDDLERAERIHFEPYLQSHWLAPVAHQLSSLSISFNECWGTAQGNFDGGGLVFPQLKMLNLGNFVISHHDHFDWVLTQTSLTHLRLNRCFIASHLQLTEEYIEKWKMPKHDWQRLPIGSFGFNQRDDCTYSFPGTWEQVFDKIRSSLTCLQEFRVGYSTYLSTDSFETMSSGLQKSRYITLDTGLLPSPWIETRDPDGKISFGNNQKSVWEPKPGESSYRQLCDLNIAKEHEDVDGRALEDLLQAVSKSEAETDAEVERKQ